MIREFFLTLVQSAALQKPRNTRTHQKRMVGYLGVPSRLSDGEGQCCRPRTGYVQPMNSPGSERATCQEGTCSESTELLAGRLGAPAQRRHPVENRMCLRVGRM